MHDNRMTLVNNRVLSLFSRRAREITNTKDTYIRVEVSGVLPRVKTPDNDGENLKKILRRNCVNMTKNMRVDFVVF